MPSKTNIALQPVNQQDLETFSKRLQAAFAVAVEEEFGSSEPIPSEGEIRSSFQAQGAAAYHITANGQTVGGVIVTIDDKSQHNSLDLFFISPQYHSQGLGLKAWQAVEAKYPQTLLWETITPYFEKRNIHFYVNKCGFQIVEFFNKYHPYPNLSYENNGAENTDMREEPCFRFEKKMK